jgi:hypothetical protein
MNIYSVGLIESAVSVAGAYEGSVETSEYRTTTLLKTEMLSVWAHKLSSRLLEHCN